MRRPAADHPVYPPLAPGLPPDLGNALDLGAISADLAVTLARRFGARTVVHLCDELVSGSVPATGSRYLVFRRAGACHDGQRATSTPVPGQITRVRSDSPVLAILDAGETVNVPYLDEFTTDQFTAQLGGLVAGLPLTGRALLAASICRDGRHYGMVFITREVSFSSEESATAVEFTRWAAARYAGAAQLRHEQSRVNGSAIVATPPGLEFCCRYLPRSGSGQSGGDWLDIIALPGGRSALVIGDVMGHGADAALTMIRCQTTVRTLAAVGLRPDELLGRFDELAPFPADDYLATCAFVEYDPAIRSCRYASAGHIPPVLTDPDGTCRVLDQPAGAPIGVGAGPYETRTIPAGAGTIMALCTDGLMELADRDPDVALSRLCDMLGGMARRPLSEICDGILARLAPEERRDDVTLLLARFLAS